MTLRWYDHRKSCHFPGASDSTACRPPVHRFGRPHVDDRPIPLLDRGRPPGASPLRTPGASGRTLSSDAEIPVGAACAGSCRERCCERGLKSRVANVPRGWSSPLPVARARRAPEWRPGCGRPLHDAHAAACSGAGSVTASAHLAQSTSWSPSCSRRSSPCSFSGMRASTAAAIRRPGGSARSSSQA
jgi:hypothetical protein